MATPTATVTIAGTVSGGISGTKILAPPTISNTTSTDGIGAVSLAVGFNTVSVPPNAVGCVIVPPAANTVTIALKGVTGDTGVPLHLTNATLLSFASGTTSFGLTIGTGGLTPDIWFF